MLLIVVICLPTVGGRAAATPASPAAATAPQPLIDGISTTATSTYVVDPAALAVHATVSVTLTNETPPRGNGYSYLPTFSVGMAEEATGVTAHRPDGSELSVRVHGTTSPYIDAATVSLTPPLYYGETQQLTVTYDIPAVPARSPGFSRVNAAFMSFPVFPSGDPGKTDVEIDVPSSFALETSGDSLEVEHRGDVDVYTAKAIADPETWLALVAAHDDTALLRAEVRVGDATLATLAWPGDQEWSDFIADHIRRGIPALESAIGLPWPGPAVDVAESAAPYLYGYGGWYTRQDHRVDIGDDLDPVVVVHELSHIWFNEAFVNSRWVNEGLAQEYASEVVPGLGEAGTPPQPIDPSAPGAIVLEDWASPDLKSPISEAQETYGYNASYSIIHDIAAEIGPERMRAVIAAAAAKTIPYRGDPEPETLDSVADWHRFLDLLVEVGGSTHAEGLVRDHVANALDQSALAARAESRVRYAALRTAGGDWSPPFTVRRELADWSFETADADMAAATGILGVRDQIAAALAPLRLPVPAPLEAEYETATDLDVVATDASRTLDAADAIAAAETAVHRSVDPIGRIGLLGGSADRALRDAKHDLADGRPDDAVAAAHRAQAAVRDATRSGVLRLLAIALIAVVGYAASRLVRARRRRRAERRSDQEPDPDPTGDEPTQAPYSAA